MSAGTPEDKSTETRVENAIEVALPFVDDFSYNSDSGRGTELEVCPLSLLQISIVVISYHSLFASQKILGNYPLR